LEFSATFGAAPVPKEHIGLTGSDDLNSGPWAIFSTAATGDQLYARTDNNLDPEAVASLGTGYLGSGHRYRIEWTTSSIIYSVDGSTTIVTHTVPQITDPNQMRPIVSSVFTDTSLIVDWLRMSPYATSCAFQSRVFDAGSSVSWQNLNWVGQQPAGTIVGNFETRSGNVALPDGSWSPWTSVSGTAITVPSGRYLQYRTQLTTTNSMVTPAVERVALSNNTKTSQTITFNPLPNKTYGDPPFTVSASASSGLQVTFTVSGACTSSGATGATVTLTGAGTCTVTAHQAGNATYNPAPDVPQTFNIAKATPVITWANPANIVYGTALGATQ